MVHAWRWLNPRWRKLGGIIVKGGWRGWLAAWLQVLLWWPFWVIENYHFDFEHPERWQK